MVLILLFIIISYLIIKLSLLATTLLPLLWCPPGFHNLNFLLPRSHIDFLNELNPGWQQTFSNSVILKLGFLF